MGKAKASLLGDCPNNRYRFRKKLLPIENSEVTGNGQESGTKNEKTGPPQANLVNVLTEKLENPQGERWISTIRDTVKRNIGRGQQWELTGRRKRRQD